jgi:hypothetical protein
MKKLKPTPGGHGAIAPLRASVDLEACRCATTTANQYLHRQSSS